MAVLATMARWVWPYPRRHSQPIPLNEALAQIRDETSPIGACSEVLSAADDGQEVWVPAFWRGRGGTVWRPGEIWFQDASGNRLGEVLRQFRRFTVQSGAEWRR